MRFRIASLVVLALGAVGCGSEKPGSEAISKMDPASLSSEAEIRAFAEYNPILFYFVNQALALGLRLPGAEVPEFEGACPTITREEGRMRIVGGCTTEDGVRIEGEVEFVTAASGLPHGRLTFKGFTQTDTVACDAGGEVTITTGYDGTVELTGNATASSLRMNMAMTTPEIDDEACTATALTVGYAYEGKIDGPVPDLLNEESVNSLTPSTWNGKGQVGLSTYGYVDIETVDEVMDFVACSTGAMSGNARLTGEKQVEFTFHGAQECGTPATWTLDGVDQGELEGVTCSALGGGTLSGFGLLALGGLLLRRRRTVN